MKVLILGGTGAMGKSLVQILANQNMNVYVTSRKKHSNFDRIHYLQGNAHDIDFLKYVLREKYDVIVDFMSYSKKEFEERVEFLLKSTGQYIFLSSCRVYAPTDEIITEESPRLLDVCDDEEYLATSEYALEKAREEDILLANSKVNWTIIRPTVTYNEDRLQLGSFEMQNWIYRITKGRTLLFPEELLDVSSPMTYGGDVALVISKLVGNSRALGEIIQIATSEVKTWREILEIYIEEFEECKGFRPKIIYTKNAEELAAILGRKWQLKYNRLYDRRFSCTKADRICNFAMEYISMENGLRKSLRKAMSKKLGFSNVHWVAEAYMDRVTKERTELSEINSNKEKIKYLIARYTPYFKWKYNIHK